MLAVTHWLQEVERDAIFSVFAQQVDIVHKRLAMPAHAHPDFMSSPLVAPRIVKNGIAAFHGFTAHDAICAGQLTIAKRGKHQGQFAAGYTPGGIWQSNSRGAMACEVTDGALE